MRELALVGLSDDRRHLLARDPVTGEEMIVHADGRFSPAIGAIRAAMSNTPVDRSPADSYVDRHTAQRLARQPYQPAQSAQSGSAQTQPPREAAMESSLTPREIQARIRRGEDPDDVATAAGVTRQSIEGYVIPVLAEREHVCEKARDTIIRRRHVSGPGVKLGDLGDDAVRARGGKNENVIWDSWRNEDGRWTLLISTGADTAAYTYDVQDRYVIPADQNSRELVGDTAGPDSTDTALADALDSGQSPTDGTIDDSIDHTADGDLTADAEEPTGDHGTETATTQEQPPVGDDDASTPPGVSSLRAARERRAMEQLALSDDWPTQSSTPTAQPSRSAPVDSPPAHDSSSAPEIPTDTADGLETAESPETSDAGQPGSSKTTGPDDVSSPGRSSGKRRQERRRVPSWDEIMFGQTSD